MDDLFRRKIWQNFLENFEMSASYRVGQMDVSKAKASLLFVCSQANLFIVTISIPFT